MSGQDVKVHPKPALALGAAAEAVAEYGGMQLGPGEVKILKRRRGGPASKRPARIEKIVSMAAELGPGATRNRVAAALGHANEDEEPHGGFKDDVRAAGGWEAIMRRAREL